MLHPVANGGDNANDLYFIKFWFKYNLDRSTTLPKLDLAWVQTLDLLIMTVTVHFLSVRHPFYAWHGVLGISHRKSQI